MLLTAINLAFQGCSWLAATVADWVHCSWAGSFPLLLPPPPESNSWGCAFHFQSATRSVPSWSRSQFATGVLPARYLAPCNYSPVKYLLPPQLLLPMYPSRPFPSTLSNCSLSTCFLLFHPPPPLPPPPNTHNRLRFNLRFHHLRHLLTTAHDPAADYFACWLQPS